MATTKRSETVRYEQVSATGTPIPSRWLQGRSLMNQRQGMDFVAAYRQAIEDWNEQERLAAQFAAERA